MNISVCGKLLTDQWIHYIKENCTNLLQPPPTLKDFDEEQFLKIVEGAGPQMTSGVKGNWVPLYK